MEPDEEPDVEIGARARAREVRFRARPRTRVESHGEVAERGRRTTAETASGGERENLPDEVEPGAAYRDVEIGWRATVRLVGPPARGRSRSEPRPGEAQSG